MGLISMSLAYCGGSKKNSPEDEALPRQGIDLNEKTFLTPWKGSLALSADGKRGIFLDRKGGDLTSVSIKGFEEEIGVSSIRVVSLLSAQADLAISEAYLTPDGQAIVVKSVAAQGEDDRLVVVGWGSGERKVVTGLNGGKIKNLFFSPNSMAMFVTYAAKKSAVYAIALNEQALEAINLTANPNESDELIWQVFNTDQGVNLITNISLPESLSTKFLMKTFSNNELNTTSSLRARVQEVISADNANLSWLEGRWDGSKLERLPSVFVKDHFVVAAYSDGKKKISVAGDSSLISKNNETVILQNQLKAYGINSDINSDPVQVVGHQVRSLNGSKAADLVAYVTDEVRRCKDSNGNDGQKIYGRTLAVWQIGENTVSRVPIYKEKVAGKWQLSVGTTICDSRFDDRLIRFDINSQATANNFRIIALSILEDRPILYALDRNAGIDSIKMIEE